MLRTPRIDYRYTAEWRAARFLLAARDGNITALKNLLPVINCNVRDDLGRTGLMLAAAMAQNDCLKILLPVIDARLVDSESWTALMRAAVHHSSTCLDKRLDCIKLLLPFSNVNALNCLGSNALMLAIKSENILAIEFLAAHTNLALMNTKGQTAYDLAVEHGLCEFSGLLKFEENR